jgi:hypothetical protein
VEIVILILPEDGVTIHKVDAVVIPKLPHSVADVVSFNNKARGLRGPWAYGARLVEVVYRVASHLFISLIDVPILAHKYGKRLQRKWKYNGDFRALLLSRDRANFARASLTLMYLQGCYKTREWAAARGSPSRTTWEFSKSM